MWPPPSRGWGLGGIDGGLALPFAARLSEKLDGLSRRSDEGSVRQWGLRPLRQSS
jgi:hypothetical protein